MDTGFHHRHRDRYQPTRREQADTYRHMASKKIHKILRETSVTNVLHKRQIHTLRQLRNKLKSHNAIVTHADKGKTIVIINTNEYDNKINQFLHDNNFHTLHKDPTNKYQKQIINIVQTSNKLIDKHNKKYLTQINP